MMNIKTLKFLLLGVLLLLFGAHAADFAAGSPEESKDLKNSILFRSIYQVLNGFHYAPQDVDDQLSRNAYEKYLESLDYNKRFFTQKDIEKLAAYQTELDDQFKNGKQEFFDLSVELMRQRITQVEGFYEKLLEKPFDFQKDESLQLDAEYRDYPKNDKALKDIWRKYLKYQTMLRLTSKLERQEKNEDVEQKPLEELEKEARQDVRKSQSEFFHRMSKLKKSDWLTMYVNAMTNQYDPHTGYFPPKDKENFDIGISGQLEGIGATLYEKEGYITVARIVPGSACWKQGDLEVGDRITKVAQGDGEPVDIVDARVDDAVKLIRGKKGTEVRLTVLKADDTEEVIPIIRDVVVIEETYAKSALLGQEKSIGYIKLPKFYTDFTGRGGRTCSKDMEKELIRLQEQNVEGVIVDLRNNGGGSLSDVVDIAGQFIDKGPVVQVKARSRKAQQLKDKRSGVIYDGPLVILVNAYSASASEILAAAMQDYGRALIVGTDSATFGKGTVQRFYDLDQFLNKDFEEVKPLGAIKLTLQKFYRVNGGATQLRGVTPDIQIPNPRSLVRTGERERETAMSWDEIEAADYTTWDVPLPVTGLREKSQRRIAENPTFALIRENADWLKKRREERDYSLNLDVFRKNKAEAEARSDKYDAIEAKIESMHAAPLPSDRQEMQQDSTRLKTWEQWEKGMKKDPYLYETTQIMQDLIAAYPPRK